MTRQVHETSSKNHPTAYCQVCLVISKEHSGPVGAQVQEAAKRDSGTRSWWIRFPCKLGSTLPAFAPASTLHPVNIGAIGIQDEEFNSTKYIQLD